MKNFFIGLVLGILLCGGAYFIFVPQIKQTEYDNGFSAGNKKGTADGTAAGITQGIAQYKADLKQKHDQDSVAAVKKYQAAMRSKAARRVIKPVAKPQQNWHVINGKIDDPIVEQPAPAEPATKK